MIRHEGWAQSISISFRSPQRSATAANFLVLLCRIWVRVQISPNRQASSSTHFLGGLSCHNTNILCRPFLAGFRCHFDSPCFLRVRNCCQHDDYAFSFAPVDYLHCVSTRLDHHDHRGLSSLCTTSCCQRVYSSTHLCGSHLQGALIIN